jgi:hypothetical protein
MRFWKLAVLLVALAGMAFGQSTFGEIRGTVSDPSGAVLPGATLTARNVATGESQTTKSDAQGNYAIYNLDAGTYELTVEASGFRKALTQNIAVRAREIARIDPRMEVQGTSTEVLVTAAAQVINTEQAAIIDSKSSAQIQAIPVNFRAGSTNSVASTLSFTPGVQADGGGNLSLAGNLPYMLTSSIDGISSINVRSNGILTEMFPSADGIDEIKISTTSTNAEYAQVGDITTTSKSGSNTLHGGVYWYHQNGFFDAKDYFATRTPFKVSNDFGGSVGGPVIKNRTFFFFDVESLRYRAQGIINATVPPDSYRTGDLSSVTATIRDPLNGQPFSGNMIPLARISPVSLKILDTLYPRQNVPGNAINAANYRVQLPGGNTNNQFDVRGDHVINSQQNIFARFTYKDTTTASPIALPALGDAREAQEVRALTVAHNYLIKPNVVNEIRVGYASRPRIIDFGPNGQSFDGPALSKTLGLQGLRSDLPRVASVPDFGITGFNGTGRSRGFTQASKTMQFTDNLTWTVGRHTMKFGGDVRRLRLGDNVSFFSGDDLGEYRWNGLFSGNPMADFLLGYPQRTRLANTGPDITGKTWHQAFYAQDDFRVNRKLTLNYGLRWEFHKPFFDDTLQMANFERYIPGGRVVVPNEASVKITAPGFRASIGSTPIVTAAEAGLPEALRSSDLNNFMPRFGFAYRPFGDKTVIRGGYGIYSVTILGAVFYSLVGIHTSDTRTFDNRLENGAPLFTFPQPFLSGLGTVTQVGNADFRRGNQIDSPDPYVQQWSLTVERDLGWNTGLRMTYTGSHTVKLYMSPDLNQVRANTVGYATARQSRPFPNWAIVYSRDPNAGARYNALTTEVNKRMSNHLTFQTSWTWAKNLSNATGSNSTSFPGEAGAVPTDRFNLDLDTANVSATRRHRWLTTFLYELPGGRNWNPFVKALAGGWNASGILLFQTGPFLTPIIGGRTDPSGTNVDARANDRPDYTGQGDGNLPSEQRTVNRWFDRSAFTFPASNIGRFGYVGPGGLVGPGTAVVSMKLQKRFYYKERAYLQLEGAATNLMNHPNLGVPGLNINASNFGVITSTQGQEGSGARQLQVGLRFAF